MTPADGAAGRRTPRTEADERFAGLLGAWDDDNPLPYMMRAFADAMAVEYRGWAEMIRGWAHRIEREDQVAAAAQVQADEAVGLLRRLVDHEDSPCRYDHYGYCQEHNLENPCSIADARDFLARHNEKGEIE